MPARNYLLRTPGNGTMALSGGMDGPPSLARMEWDYIQDALRECNGNITRAAMRLRLHRRTLQRKLRKLPPDA